MYVAEIPNRSSPPAILLRESYREGGKVKTRTLANLSRWPPEQIEALRRVLAGETVVPVSEALVVERTLPHGHVLAVLGTLRRLGLERILHSRPGRERDGVVAMIVARILDPRSKLATARGLDDATASSSPGEALGLGAPRRTTSTRPWTGCFRVRRRSRRSWPRVICRTDRWSCTT